MEGAQRQVVHTKEEVRLACLDGLVAVEHSAPGMLCAVEELLVELGAAHVVACVVVHIVVAGGDHTYWQGVSGEQGHMHRRGSVVCG